MQQGSVPEETRTPPGRWAAIRHGGLGLLLGLVIGGLGAAFVYVDGRERLAELDARRAAQALEVDQSVQSIRDQVEAARSSDALLRARIAADRALAELERANFGLSQEQLQYADLALANVKPELIGVDPVQLDEARSLLNATRLEAVPDAALQRTRLESVVRALDALIPRDQRG